MTERELLDGCESQLGSFKTPSRIHLVNDLPKGPSGKVQRLRLADCFKELIQPEHHSTPNAFSGNGHSTPPLASEFELPRTPLEEMIAETWAELLQVDRVGVHCNFFALGGHSLLAIETLSRVRKQFAVELSFNEFFTNPTVAQLAALVKEQLFPNEDTGPVQQTGDLIGSPRPLPIDRAALEETLRKRQRTSASQGTILPRDQSQPCPLSHAQERLWFLTQLYPGMRAYNEGDAVRLQGPLDLRILEEALNAVVARHEILRTLIQVVGDRLVQVIHESWPIHFTIIDLSSMGLDERASEVERLLIAEFQRPFDLAVEPGFRAVVLRLSLEEHVVILTLHHIVCDGWSLGLLFRELEVIYQALSRGEPHDLEPLRIQYGDYAVWQRRQFEEGAFAKELTFWKNYLTGAPPAIELPIKGPRPEVFSYAGEKRIYPLGRGLTESLHGFSRGEQVSLFMVLTAAVNVLLSRYSGQEDIVLGIPIANRDRPELSNLFGFLIDFQALRTDLSGNPTFRELLQRVQQGILDVNAHRAVPFNKVVEALHPQRNLTRSPIFQTMLVWKDRAVQMQFLDLAGLTSSHVLAHPRASKFDLTLFLTDVGDDLWLEVEYCTDLFPADSIEQMAEGFQTLLAAIVVNPDVPIGNLPLLSAARRRQLLTEWNNTWADYPREACIHELFEAQARRTPNQVAVVCEGRQLTYHELNRRADQLAQHLHTLGVNPDVLVAIHLERSLEMIVGLLAILKAGVAYLPLDPLYPPNRLAFMLEDARPLVLLTQRHLQDSLPPHSCQVVCLDQMDSYAAEQLGAWAASANGVARRSPTPASLAYVLYTSGSTGQPKGVEVSHRGVVNLLTDIGRRLGCNERDVLLSVTTLAFDIAALELFLPLISGARLVLANREIAADGTRLAELMKRSSVTIMQATPATWRMLIDAGWSGQERLQILCGGEALTPALATNLLGRCGSLWNLYGPTETTIWSTCERVEAVEDQVTIGRPIANTRVYILDANGQPTPPGVAGELFIGGDGVAKGYLNRPDLTTKRFVPDPFVAEPACLTYRTGDKACYLPDGRIEFLGRLDHQVKVRGFRVELGEIETVLERHPAVRQAVAVAVIGPDGTSRLAAYIVAQDSAPSATELREHLRTQLPDYMVPAVFVPLPALPLTPNGKVDRRALPAPQDPGSERNRDFQPPRTRGEKLLAEIWCRVLGLKQVGIRDNFFDLGGHSLLANNPAYNFSRAIRLTGVLDVEVLERCLVELRRRHEVLRTTFVSVVGEPVQRVSSVVSETLSVRNLGYLLEKSARLSCTGISLQKGSVPSICHRT